MRNGTTTAGELLQQAIPGIASSIVVRLLFAGISPDDIDAVERRAVVNHPTFRPARLDE